MLTRVRASQLSRKACPPFALLVLSSLLSYRFSVEEIALRDGSPSCKLPSGSPPRPILTRCPARVCAPGSRSCWTFTSECESSNAISVPGSCPAEGSSTTLVTAFLPVRGDRAIATWRDWVTKTAEVPADIVAWLPRHDVDLIESFLKARKTHRPQYNTCVLRITQSQLPYNYLIPKIEDKLFGKVPYVPAEEWNKDSVELTTAAYLPVQFSKVPYLFATSQIFGGKWFVWIDAGLSRHVEHFGDEAWPSEESISSLHTSSVYVSSWDGYGEATDAWIAWCNEPDSSFRKNRNLLAGTVIFASSWALDRFLPLWTEVFEEMVMPHSPWNNEQVVFSLVGCALPDLIGVIDTRKLPKLWTTMQARTSIVNISRVPKQHATTKALCAPWAINSLKYHGN